MKKLLFALALILAPPAWAAPLSSGFVVTTCGTLPAPPGPYLAGRDAEPAIDLAGNMCISGTISSSLTGSTSNASSGVATSSTNIPTVSYNYGFNGTTWDQLQVDGSKFLKVNVATPLIAGTALIGKVGIDQTTPGTTNGVQLPASQLITTGAAGSPPGGSTVVTVQPPASGSTLFPDNISQINGVTPLMGQGKSGTGSPRVTIADINVGIYKTIAASQTAQALGTGATGDYLQQLICAPTSTSPGVVTILDNAISINLFAGGASSLSNLAPLIFPVNAYSVSGAWKVTTGAAISCLATGNFTP